MTSLTIHDQAYEFYDWQTLGDDIFRLAQKIIASGHQYDRIVALAKGGLTFARSMVDYLGVEAISSIQIEFYSGINETQRLPVITQSLPVSIRNENILIFDDIVDKGETIVLAKNYLQQHGTKNIEVATLIQKPWAKAKADFFARSSEAWVIFPNEIRETIHILTNKWHKMGDSPEVIRKNLLQLGFSKDEVELFANLK